MKTRLRLTPAVVILLCMIMSHCTTMRVRLSFGAPTNGGVEEARAAFRKAYNATVEAEKAGALVAEAAKKLNEALDYVIQAERLAAHGDIEQALLLTRASIQLSEEIIVLTQELQEQAETTRYTRLMVYIAVSIGLIILSIYTFFMGKRMWKRHQQKKFREMIVKETPSTK